MYVYGLYICFCIKFSFPLGFFFSSSLKSFSIVGYIYTKTLFSIVVLLLLPIAIIVFSNCLKIMMIMMLCCCYSCCWCLMLFISFKHTIVMKRIQKIRNIEKQKILLRACVCVCVSIQLRVAICQKKKLRMKLNFKNRIYTHSMVYIC